MNFDNHIQAIKQFADEYNGVLCTETMLISGKNDTLDKITGIARIIKTLHPHTAYLSIPIRPPAVKFVKAPAMKRINEAWQIFNRHHIQTELLTGFEGTNSGYTGNAYDDILNITAVHPLREDSLNQLLKNDSVNYSVVETLISQQLIQIVPYDGKKYFLRKYHY